MMHELRLQGGAGVPRDRERGLLTFVCLPRLHPRASSTPWAFSEAHSPEPLVELAVPGAELLQEQLETVSPLQFSTH